MSRRSAAATTAVLAALPVCPAHAALLNLDFDDLPAGNGVVWQPDHYLASHHVRFSSAAGTLYSWDDPSNGQFIATTQPTYVYGGSPSVPWSTFSLEFFANGTPGIFGVTDFVRFDVVDYPNETSQVWSWAAYATDGVLLDSGSGTGSGVTVTISTPEKSIHRVVFTPSNDFEGFDTLSFESPVGVPEPSASLLAGLAGGVLLRRRRVPTRASR